MEEHSLHTNNQPLPTESEKMTTKEEVALRHHFLLTNTKQPDVEAELKRFKQKQQLPINQTTDNSQQCNNSCRITWMHMVIPSSFWPE